MLLPIEELTDKLDDLLSAKGKHVRRSVDAGACQTQADYRRMHEAEEELENKREEFLTLLQQALKK